ncbi:GMC oxidoreductase [Pararhizobium sp. DWP3-4]|uniref:GMC oxidoreductase n=1 Tax=Pararhizobium sp. DWP3-4 TaxID=2804565 RepID=UPI003CF6BBFE
MAFRDLTSTTNATLIVTGDLCVVGGGIAGLLLAIRVARAGRKVIVLESGKKEFDSEIQNLNFVDDESGRYGRELSGRYRGLGGTSSRWGGRMIPLSDRDTDERPHVDLPAWPINIAGLDSYSDEIERFFGVANGPFDQTAMQGIGEDLLSDDSMEVRWAKCPAFTKCNVATLLKRELQITPNLEIWLDATACNFTVNRETGRLAELAARNSAGKTIHVVAKHYVLAAGTIESTRLLLLMDRCADGQVFGKASVLGHYFQDHLKIEVAEIARAYANLTNRFFAYRFLNATRRDLHLELPHHAQEEAGTGSAFAYIAMDFANGPLAGLKKLMQGLQRRQFNWKELSLLPQSAGILSKAAYWRLMRSQLYVPPDVKFKVMLCAEQLPNWQNTISLSSATDILGIPKAKLDWRPMESEERTFRATIARLRLYWEAAGLNLVCPLIWSWTALDNDAAIIPYAEACAHPSGTTRMGTDPKKSIVDADLRCHAVPNLSVVSASVFPTAGSANPTFTIMKLAFFFADTYLAKS